MLPIPESGVLGSPAAVAGTRRCKEAPLTILAQMAPHLAEALADQPNRLRRLDRLFNPAAFDAFARTLQKAAAADVESFLRQAHDLYRSRKLLADAGLGDLARRFALPADGIAPLPLVTYMDALTLQARCEVLENPGPDTVQALEDVLARCESVGPARRAAGAALRAAWDCERVGLADEAQRLRSRGLRGLPPQGEWTQREVYYAARLSGIGTNVNHNGALGVRPGEILVLGPDVVMRRYGREVHTGGMAARMVVLLVAHRRAVTTDWLLEQLWPGEDPEVGRNRLKGLLFRSRRLLDLGRGELFVRDEHGISLVPGPAWRIDAWDFWDLSRGSTPERRQAFELYRGDLCFRQFAYDDELAAERGRLRDRWLELTLGLLAEGEMDAGDVADRALRLGIEEPLLQVALGHIGPGE